MTVTAFFTNKGGVGKTTFACNVGNAIASRGRRVLMIDADPQCNASTLMLGHEYLDHLADVTTLEDIITPVRNGQGYVHDISPIYSYSFGVYVVPCHPVTALSEDLLGADWWKAKGGDVRGVNTSLFFKEFVDRQKPFYDDVIIDCGPSFGPLTRCALLAADEFVSPIGSDAFSKIALVNMIRWFGKLNQNLDGMRRILESDGEDRLLRDVKIPSFAGIITKGQHRGMKINVSDLLENLGQVTGRNSNDDMILGNLPDIFQVAKHAQDFNNPMISICSEAGTEFKSIARKLRSNEMAPSISF